MTSRTPALAASGLFAFASLLACWVAVYLGWGEWLMAAFFATVSARWLRRARMMSTTPDD